MATSSCSSTPRKTCILSDTCILCGFAFIQIEKTSTGEEKVHKFFETKLRLTSERLEIIQNVTGLTDIDVGNTSGVCKKCYRAAESIVKTESKNSVIKQKFREVAENTIRKNMLQLPSPKRKSITKRMLRSPNVHVPSAKKQPFDISHVNLVKIRPFLDLTNIPVDVQNTELPQPPRLGSFIPIAPKEKQDNTSTCSTKIQGSKRSLNFGNTNKDLRSTPLDGSIELSINYPSGQKSRIIIDDDEKKVCKIIFRGKDIDRGLRDYLKTANPSMLVEGSLAILGDECRNLCKRNSGSVLQDKSSTNVLEFTWDSLYAELQIRAPNVLKTVSAMVTDIPIQVNQKPFHQVMYSVSQILHGRSQEMSLVQYLSGFVLLHGGCTLKDIERIAKLGASVNPVTLRRKLNSWDAVLDEELLMYKEEWSQGGHTKYQLIGDNWDRNIIPSYRTSQDKTLSLHLFQVIGVLDRVNCIEETDSQLIDVLDLNPVDFIPSRADQDTLLHELTFLFASSVIANIDQMNGMFGSIYPTHLQHKYSNYSGRKTEQYSLGLFDCNEMVTQDVIRLLKELSRKYVPMDDAGEIVEEVFFGGDRLTDERIQSAQEAMSNNETPLEKLEGFISKIEDFHRLMNFLEAIVMLTYSTQSANDRGTMYYFKNILNARNVKGKVKNSYRGYKMLYRTVFDAMCSVLFLKEFGVDNLTENIPLPGEFSTWNEDQRIQWLNNICEEILKKWFFKDGDLFEDLRRILSDPDHEENYWSANFQDGRFSCHYCEKSYCHLGSAESHEKVVHGHSKPSGRRSEVSDPKQDELFDYLLALFRLSALHRNLDSAVDMADGNRSVRSAKYETPLYNKTQKTKYLIGSIHLTSLVSETYCQQIHKFIWWKKF